MVRSISLPVVATFARSAEGGRLPKKAYTGLQLALQKLLEVLSSFGTEAQPFLKYHCDHVLWKVFRDSNPWPVNERYAAQPAFTGLIRRIVLRRVARRDVSFCYSLQKGSRQAWPQLPDSYLQAALKKHESLICGTRVPLDGVVLESIGACSRELFASLDGRSHYEKFLPTGHAAYNSGRKTLGTRRLVRPLTLPVNPESELTLRGIHHKAYAHRSEEFLQAQSRLSQRISSGDPDVLSVKVVPLPEAGKFRILTVGDEDLYNSLQALQGALLGLWKSHPTSTMRSEDLEPRWQKMADLHHKLGTGFTKMVSGDYSAATDTLSREATMAALSGASGSAFYKLALHSIGPGKISYPVGRGRYRVADGPHKEGQLMGHPLSFPLLCAINLSTYRHALQAWVDLSWSTDSYESRRHLACELRNCVLVNGDDIGFFADDELYACWKASARAHGFAHSDGKNYFSSYFGMMNSQVVSVSRSFKGPPLVRRHGYISQKVISGNSLKGGESLAGPAEISRDLDRMCRLYPESASCVHDALRRATEMCQSGPFRPNWHAPVVTGGLGFLPELLSESNCDRRQRQFAAQFVNEGLSLMKEKSDRLTCITKPISGTKRAVLGDYVCLPHESLTPRSGLDSFLRTLNEWRHLHNKATVDRRRGRFKLNHRYEPMSVDKMRDYQTPLWVYSGGTSFPAGYPLRCGPMPWSK